MAKTRYTVFNGEIVATDEAKVHVSTAFLLNSRGKVSKGEVDDYAEWRMSVY